MPRARSRLSLASALLFLAGMPSLAAAQSYVKLYLTWNNAPFDGYHASMSAIVYEDGQKLAGNPFNVGWGSGLDYGLLELNGTGEVTIDTVLTYDPAGLCSLIGTSGVAVGIGPTITGSVSMALQYRWCSVALVPSTATGAAGLVEFLGAGAVDSYADTVYDGGYDEVHLGAKAGQFPHGSQLTIRITPFQGSSVMALGRTAGPGQEISVDTTMNTAVIVRATFFFAPTFTITLGGGNPAANDTIAKGTTKAPMIEFSMNPSTTQTLSSVMLSASGTGDQHTDIEHVKLYEDLNGNGKVDSGDPLLGSGAYGVDNTMTLTVDPAFSFTGPTNFLVTYDFNVTIVQELFGSAAVLAMFPLFLLPVMRRRRRTLLLGLAMLTVSVAALSSCGGSDGSTGPPPAQGSSTYQAEVTSVTVSGTAHPTTLMGHTVTVLK